NVLESSVTIIAKQNDRLFESRGSGNSIHLRVDMSIHKQNVEPAIVVHVKKRSPPSHREISGLCQFGANTDIFKAVFAKIVIERVGLFGEVRNKHGETAFMQIISPIHAHRTLFQPIAAERDPR